MSTVLISFIGRGQPQRQGQEGVPLSPSGYVRTSYLFPAEGRFPSRAFQASFFGAALLQHLIKTKRQPARWLIMGTAQSLWNDLIEIVPAEKQAQILPAWDSIDEAVKGKSNGPLTTADLLNWQGLLGQQIPETQILCRMVGAAETMQSQELIYGAMLEAIQERDEVVFDITHGFRHQPVIAGFMIALLRWLRSIRTVHLYYGPLEMRSNSPDCPVLKLPLCNFLLNATEAVAMLRLDGNYKPLGACVLPDADKQIAKLAFCDEVNRPITKMAHDVRRELGRKRAANELSLIQSSLSGLLDDALLWTSKGSLAERLLNKADAAFSRHQFSKAINLLWEGLLTAAGTKFGIPDLTKQNSRSQAEDSLYTSLTGGDKRLLLTLECLRNAVIHGTPPTRRDDVGNKVRRALDDPTTLKRLFNRGRSLAEKVLTENNGSAKGRETS